MLHIDGQKYRYYKHCNRWNDVTKTVNEAIRKGQRYYIQTQTIGYIKPKKVWKVYIA